MSSAGVHFSSTVTFPLELTLLFSRKERMLLCLCSDGYPELQSSVS